MARKQSNLSSGYTVHNKVKLVRGGKLYFELLERMIDEAKYSLHFQTYIFDEDQTGMTIARALMRAASREVKVFLLLDGYASQDLSPAFIEELQEAGVHFRWFGPILKNRYLYFGRRLHHKVVVADAHRCLIGGVNITDRYNDLPDQPAWLDWAMLAEGEVALAAFAVCARRAQSRWIPWSRKVIMNPPVLKIRHERCLVRLRVNDWVLGKSEISTSYVQMLRHAKTDVIILSSYFMPGGEFRRALRQAVKRGTKVQVILAGISDIKLAKQAERYLYGWLLRHKIEVFEYTRNILHGKIACCDDEWMTVGSYNMNDLSAKASVELNLEVTDPALALEVRQVLREIILHDCVQITAESEKRTSMVDRVIQKSAYNILRLILFVFTFYFRQQKG